MTSPGFDNAALLAPESAQMAPAGPSIDDRTAQEFASRENRGAVAPVNLRWRVGMAVGLRQEFPENVLNDYDSVC